MSIFKVNAQLMNGLWHISAFPRIPPSFSERGPRSQRPWSMRLLI